MPFQEKNRLNSRTEQGARADRAVSPLGSFATDALGVRFARCPEWPVVSLPVLAATSALAFASVEPRIGVHAELPTYDRRSCGVAVSEAEVFPQKVRWTS